MNDWLVYAQIATVALFILSEALGASRTCKCNGVIELVFSGMFCCLPVKITVVSGKGEGGDNEGEQIVVIAT